MVIVRAVSEMATKEYAVNNNLEILDREMRSLVFELHPYKDSGALIVLRVGDLQAAFEDL